MNTAGGGPLERCCYLSGGDAAGIPVLRVVVGTGDRPAVPVIVDVPGSCATLIPRPWLASRFGMLSVMPLGPNRIDLTFPDIRVTLRRAEVLVTERGTPVLGLDVVYQLSRGGLVVFRSDGSMALRAAGVAACLCYDPMAAAHTLAGWAVSVVAVRIDGRLLRLRVTSRLPARADILLGGQHPVVVGDGAVWFDDNRGGTHRLSATRHRARVHLDDNGGASAPDVRLAVTARPPPADAMGWVSFGYLSRVVPGGTLLPTGLLRLPQRWPLLEMGAAVSPLAATFSDVFLVRRKRAHG